MKMPLIIEIGKSEEFQFGVWMSVSERSWNIYWDGYDDESYAEDGCFGYLSNTISVYPDSFNLPGDVYFQNEGFRPMVVLHNGSHRLALDQQAGMPVEVVERLMENREH